MRWRHLSASDHVVTRLHLESIGVSSYLTEVLKQKSGKWDWGHYSPDSSSREELWEGEVRVGGGESQRVEYIFSSFSVLRSSPRSAVSNRLFCPHLSALARSLSRSLFVSLRFRYIALISFIAYTLARQPNDDMVRCCKVSLHWIRNFPKLMKSKFYLNMSVMGWTAS